MKVLIAGGGTAGHVFPAIAVADALRPAATRRHVRRARDGQEATLVPAAGYPVRAGPRGRRAQTRLSSRSLRAVARALGAAAVGPAARREVPTSWSAWAGSRARRPCSPRGGPAARSCCIDQNSVPGAVEPDRGALGAAWWPRPSRPPRRGSPAGTRVERTGNPIRARDRRGASSDRARLAAEARDGLRPRRRPPHGRSWSAGAWARSISTEAVAGALRALRDRARPPAAGEHRAGRTSTVVARRDRGGRAAARARRCRSSTAWIWRSPSPTSRCRGPGASVAELAACGVPSILVPYPYATENHQEANAARWSRRGRGGVAARRRAVAVRPRVVHPRADGRRTIGARGWPTAALAWARPTRRSASPTWCEAAEAEGAA